MCVCTDTYTAAQALIIVVRADFKCNDGFVPVGLHVCMHSRKFTGGHCAPEYCTTGLAVKNSSTLCSSTTNQACPFSCGTSNSAYCSTCPNHRVLWMYPPFLDHGKPCTVPKAQHSFSSPLSRADCGFEVTGTLKCNKDGAMTGEYSTPAHLQRTSTTASIIC